MPRERDGDTILWNNIQEIVYIDPFFFQLLSQVSKINIPYESVPTIERASAQEWITVTISRSLSRISFTGQ